MYYLWHQLFVNTMKILQRSKLNKNKTKKKGRQEMSKALNWLSLEAPFQALMNLHQIFKSF